MQPEIKILPDKPALAAEAARRFVLLAQAAVAENGRFTVALSGGSTPRTLHQLLAQPPLRDQVPWQKVFVFWGDERFVPPDDADSSYLMARETLLDHVPIPPQNIHPVPTVDITPETAAQQYTSTLQSLFGESVPRFDLILLGMGPDGHTASLFPGHPEVVKPGDKLVAVVFDSPKPPPTRLTFTYQLLNAAKNVIFLVAGADKAAMVRQVLVGGTAVVPPPASLVQPANGKLTWLLDMSAAQNFLSH